MKISAANYLKIFVREYLRANSGSPVAINVMMASKIFEVMRVQELFRNNRAVRERLLPAVPSSRPECDSGIEDGDRGVIGATSVRVDEATIGVGGYAQHPTLAL